MRKARDRCGRGHDLTNPDNVMVDVLGTRRCRICRNMGNRRLHDMLPTRTKCCGCGGPKKPNKARLCEACRWKRARALVQKAKDAGEVRGRDLRAAVDEAVAAEMLMPWEKKARAGSARNCD